MKMLREYDHRFGISATCSCGEWGGGGTADLLTTYAKEHIEEREDHVVTMTLSFHREPFVDLPRLKPDAP
jgi:hypothetical protein